ncbi:ATP-grasp domain-containing protein [Branchiibius hedensis]|nr:ATP-grasp domain-containing protein [Branchiibius hedensis]
MQLYIRESVAASAPSLVDAARVLLPTYVVSDDMLVDVVCQSSPAGVTTFHDAEVTSTDEIARRCGLPGPSDVPFPWDKLHQREALRRAGSQVKCRAVDSPVALHSAVESLGLPAVLKPRCSDSSTGVAFLHTPVDVAVQVSTRTAWGDLVLETMIPSGAHPSQVPTLADYVSVETVSIGTSRTHVAIVDKLPIAVASDPGPVAVRETGILYPSRVPGEQSAAVFECVQRSLDALGVRDRITHTEVKVSDAAVEAIEVNGRLGGDIARMFAMRGGPDMIAIALLLALGRSPDVPTHFAQASRAAACLYVPFGRRHGFVRSHVDVRQLRTLPDVKAVDEVAVHGAPLSDSGFRTAKFAIESPSLDRLDRSIQAALDATASYFAADGMDNEPWLTAMRARAAQAVA